jgi:hypothetical protein
MSPGNGKTHVGNYHAWEFVYDEAENKYMKNSGGETPLGRIHLEIPLKRPF